MKNTIVFSYLFIVSMVYTVHGATDENPHSRRSNSSSSAAAPTASATGPATIAEYFKQQELTKEHVDHASLVANHCHELIEQKAAELTKHGHANVAELSQSLLHSLKMPLEQWKLESKLLFRTPNEESIEERLIQAIQTWKNDEKRTHKDNTEILQQIEELANAAEESLEPPFK